MNNLMETFSLNYRAKENAILTKRGARESLMQPLISGFGKPTGGWYVNILVKDIPHRVSESSAVRVFNRVKKMLHDNGVQARDIDIWFNLNIQWYDRLVDKYALVSKTALLELATTNVSEETTSNPSARRYTPKDWGAMAWDFMGIYLAKDVYSWDNFFNVIELIQNMLNKDQNPSIGCNECYIEFTKAVELLRKNHIYTSEEARKWLVDFHNLVNRRLNKPIFTFEAASKKYLWT